MLERYRKLIEHHVKNPHNGLGEDHHILPVSLGGEYYPKVRLSHRAHYVAHRMLWKAIGGKMTTAFHFMTTNKRYPDNRITSKEYAVLKEEFVRHQTGYKHTAESKKKMSEAKTGENRKPFTAEHKKNISKAQTGEKNHQYGKTPSAEHKKKISEANMGHETSAETRKKIGEAKTGKKRKPFSAEWKKNLSASATGRKHSAETLKKMRESHKKRRAIV